MIKAWSTAGKEEEEIRKKSGPSDGTLLASTVELPLSLSLYIFIHVFTQEGTRGTIPLVLKTETGDGAGSWFSSCTTELHGRGNEFWGGFDGVGWSARYAARALVIFC